MEEQVTKLVDKAWDRFQQMPEDRRFMIAISGIPGSDLYKTSMPAMQCSIPEIKEAVPVAAFVPMDGDHLTRVQLSAMPNPNNAHARRGAEFTFDGPSFLKLVESLRVPLSVSTKPIYAPSFDHAVKDPKENDITILPGHRILLFEGNYVCLDREPWRTAADMMDERWFVDVPLPTARERLVKRHLKAGIAKDEEEARRRADENDLVNGKQIMDEKYMIHEVVHSRDDETWRHV